MLEALVSGDNESDNSKETGKEDSIVKNDFLTSFHANV